MRANEVEWHPEGWRATFRNGAACGTCGEPCKRADVTGAGSGSGEIVYVGDGYSDRCAAQAANRVFARDGLAGYLDEQGVAYEPFDDLHDVTRSLAPESSRESEGDWRANPGLDGHPSRARVPSRRRRKRAP